MKKKDKYSVIITIFILILIVFILQNKGKENKTNLPNEEYILFSDINIPTKNQIEKVLKDNIVIFEGLVEIAKNNKKILEINEDSACWYAENKEMITYDNSPEIISLYNKLLETNTVTCVSEGIMLNESDPIYIQFSKVYTSNPKSNLYYEVGCIYYESSKDISEFYLETIKIKEHWYYFKRGYGGY